MQYANKGQNDKAASIRRRRELVMRDEEETVETKNPNVQNSGTTTFLIQNDPNQQKDRDKKKKETTTNKPAEKKTPLVPVQPLQKGEVKSTSGDEAGTNNNKASLNKPGSKHPFKTNSPNKQNKNPKAGNELPPSGKIPVDSVKLPLPIPLPPRVPAKNKTEELDRFKNAVRQISTEADQAINQQISTIHLAAAVSRNSIRTGAAQKKREIAQSYDQAIVTIYKDAELAVSETGKAKAREKQRVEKQKALQQARLDKETAIRVKRMNAAGEQLALDAERYPLLQEKSIRSKEQAKNIELKSYIQVQINHFIKEYDAEVRRDRMVDNLGEMGKDTMDGVRANNDDLIEGVYEDASDLAERLRDEYQEASEKLPENKDDVTESIINLCDEAVKQINDVSDEPLSGLKSNAAKIVALLKSQKLQSIAKVDSIQKNALDLITNDEQRQTQELLTAQAKFKSESQSVSASLENRSAALSLQQVSQLTLRTEAGLQKEKNKCIAGAAEAAITRQKIYSTTSGEAIAEIGALYAAIAIGNGNVTAGFAKQAADAKNSIIEIYKQAADKGINGSADAVDKCLGDMDKTAADSIAAWIQELADGKSEIADKISDVQSQNDELVSDAREEIRDEAEQLASEWEATYWTRQILSVIGDIITAIVEVVLAIIAIVIAIVLLVLAVIAIVALLVVLIEALVALVVALVALIVELVVALVAFIIEGIIAVVSFVAEAAIAVFEAASSAWAAISSWVSGAWAAITGWLSSAGAWISNAWAAISAWGAGAWASLVDMYYFACGWVLGAIETIGPFLTFGNIMRMLGWYFAMEGVLDITQGHYQQGIFKIVFSALAEWEAIWGIFSKVPGLFRGTGAVVDTEMDIANATNKTAEQATAESNTNTTQPRVASGVKEDPAEFMQHQKAVTLSARQESLLERVAAEDELGAGLAKIGKREVSASDLANLTNKTGREFAIIMTKDGDRILVDLGSYKGGVLPDFTERLLIHSHPNDYGTGMAKFISPEDVEALEILNQEYSYMVTVDGKIWRFTRESIPNAEGELIRDMDYLGWTSPKNTNIASEVESTENVVSNEIKSAPQLISSDYGRMIGWGEGQSPEAIQKTTDLTNNLTRGQVQGWKQQGLPKEWVESQLSKYNNALNKAGIKLNNGQLQPRKQLMEKILSLWD